MQTNQTMPIQRGQGGDPLPQREVERYTKQIIGSSAKGGYLDHTIRAVEEYVINIRDKGTFYRISKKPISSGALTRYKKGQGYAFVFQNGANIKYSMEGDGVDRRFAIAHELGHIMLHFNHGTNTGVSVGDSRYIQDPLLESQASYFAKEVLNSRADLETRHSGHEMPLTDKAVAAYCKQYDASLLA
jgi:hypothetical protein